MKSTDGGSVGLALLEIQSLNQTEVANAEWSLSIFNSDPPLANKSEFAALFMGNDSSLTLSGKSANISVTANETVLDSSNEHHDSLFGMAVGFTDNISPEKGAVVKFDTDKTTINVSAASETTPDVVGIEAEGFSTLNLSKGTLDVSVSSNSNVINAGGEDVPENMAIGLVQSSLITAEGTTLNLTAKSNGDGTVTNLTDSSYEAGDNAAATALGLYTEGGSVTANGNVTVTTESRGGLSIGMDLEGVAGDHGWAEDHAQDISDWGVTAQFNGNLTVTSTSKTGSAQAIRIGGYSDEDGTFADYGEDLKVSRNRLITGSNSITKITATDESNDVRSIGIFFALPWGKEMGDEGWDYNLGDVQFNGTTTVTAEDALAGDAGYLSNAGTLTLNGDVDKFKGEFRQTAGTTTLNTTNGKFFGGEVSVEGGALKAEDASLTLNADSASLAVKNAALSIGTLSVEASQKLTLQNADVTANFFNVETGVSVDAGGSSFVLNGNDDEDSHIDGTITGLGDIVVNGGTLDLDSRGRMEFIDGATITFNGDAMLSFTGNMSGGDLVFNDGTYLYTPEDVASTHLEIDGGKVDFNGNVHLLGGTRGSETDLEDTVAITSIQLSHDPEDDEPLPEVTFNGGQYDFTATTVDAGTLTFTGGAGAVTIDDVAINDGTFAVTGGTVTATTMAVAGGNAEVAGGKLHADTLNSSGAFTMNVTGGEFTVGKFVGAESGAFTLAAGTMQADALDLTNGLLKIENGATLSTLSDQIFDPGLNEEGTNPEAGSLIYSEEHLSFAEGSSLTLRDEFYNGDFLTSAGSLLGSGVHITFTGTEVDSDGSLVTEKPIDDIQDGTTQSTVTITADDESGTVTVDKSVGGKNLVVGENTTTVAVSSDHTLTLVGSAEGGELVEFTKTESGTSVTVDGGLALGATGAEATKGELSTEVKLNDGASLTASNGEFSLSNVTANSADLTVNSGTTLAVANLKLEGSSTVSAAAGSTTTVATMTTADAGSYQFKGDIAADKVEGAGTLLVGSAEEGASASSTLAVKTLDHTGIIFIDPAWTDGAEMADGSFLTVEQLAESGELNADIVAGQHSTFVFGATKDDAVEAFAKTGLTYGQSGDVTAVVYIAKPISMTTGSITVDGSMEALGGFSPTDGSFTVAANGLAMIDAKALADGDPAITAKTITFDEGAHIRLVNLTATSEGTLMKAEDTLTVDDGVIEDAKSTSAIVSLNLIKNDDGTLSYTTTLNRAEDVFAGFEGAGLMNAMHEASANDVYSSDRATRFLSRMAAYDSYGVSTAAQATEIGNQAMALAATAGVYNVALDASKLMNRSIDSRMSIASGLVRGQGATVWADVLATTNEAESLYGDSGYDVDLYGGVLGVDVGLGNGKVLGAALTVGTGDGGSKGAAFNVDNDADFVGLSVYGSHRLGDFNGKVDIGWMHTTNDLSATAFGMSLDDEVKADAWTIGIGSEYLFKAGSVNIVPHVGIRWTRLDVDGYTGAFKTDDDTMNVFTAPIGVAFSGNIDATGWKFAPKVDLAIVPSFGDDEATSKVRWGNVSETIKTQVVDDAPVQLSLGLDAQNGDWTIGAFYDLGVGGDDRFDNAFTLKARYAF